MKININKKINIIIFGLLVIFSFLNFNSLALAQLDVNDLTVTDQGDPNGDGNPGTTSTTAPQGGVIIDNAESYKDQPYQPLAPLPGYPEEGFDFNDSCPLGKFMNIFIDIFIGIVAAIAMIMIVMGGINYVMSDLVTSKEDAKNNIQNAILGLVIALTCYLVLNTINPNLLNLCLDGIPKVSIELEDIPQKAVDGYYGNGQFKSGARWDDSIAQLSKLPRGVTVNKNECTTIGQQNCTSVRGLNTYIINTIANGCWESQGKKDCNIIITGGTENWLHSASGTHRPGSSTIDLSPTADINKYLTGKTTPPTPNTKLIKNGINYYYHENHGAGGYHWHIYQ